MKVLPHFKKTIPFVLIICIILISFAPLFKNNSFVWDDVGHVVENDLMHPVTSKNILQYWKKPYLKLYIPLTYTIWSAISFADSSFHSKNLEPHSNANLFHMANLLFHALNSILIFLILVKLVPDKRAACIGALFFGIHPVQVESVAWVSEFRTLLSCFFSLLSIHQYLIYNKNHPKQIQKGRKHITHYVLAVLFFSLALLSKPISIVIPLFLYIINHFFLKNDIKTNLKNIAPWIALTVPIIWVTIISQPQNNVSYIPSLWLRPFIALDSAAFYLFKLFYPNPFCIDYGRTPEFVLNQWWGYVSGLFPLGCLALLWAFRRKLSIYLACFAIFCVGFLPVSGIIPFAFQSISTVADRYLYFSMLGPAIAVAIYVQNKTNRIYGILFTIIISLLMTITFAQTITWDNGMKLYTQALRFNPRSHMSLNNIAADFSDNLIEQITLYQKAIESKPDYKLALSNLAGCISQLKTDYPAFESNQFIKDNLDEGKMFFKMGTSAAESEQLQKALLYYGKSIDVNPFHIKTHNNIGAVFIMGHYYKLAKKHLELAIVLEPDNSYALNNLGINLFALGEKEPAINYFKKAAAVANDNSIILTNLEKAVYHSETDEQLSHNFKPKFTCLFQ